jgi:ABC-2 type transport system ATP-binding protein
MTTSGIVRVDHLTKDFGRVRAVDDLSFTVQPGRVTGFLGPNGAGKTTTLRMLLGLVRPTAGTATIDGRHYRDIQRPLRVVGAALEASSFHPGRSARDHLRVLAPQAGVPDSRADEVLALVGLTDAAGRRVGGFSLGMRQRLALAATLLGDPPVLLLDEPANGLDPEGIAWLRTLLRHLAGQGRTVLVSSHVLAEVQQTVDEVVIIARGRLVRASTLAELEASADAGVVVRSPDSAGLDRLIAERGWRQLPDGAEALAGGAARRVLLGNLALEEVGAAAFAAGVELHELSRRDAGLERTFFELTEAAPPPERHPAGVALPGADGGQEAPR